jgi:hypothetical protein
MYGTYVYQYHLLDPMEKEQQVDAVLEAVDPLVGSNLCLYPLEHVSSDDEELEYSDDDGDDDSPSDQAYGIG